MYAANRFFAARDRGADRGAKPFGETHGNRVKMFGVFARLAPRSDTRVHEPCSVEVHAQVELLSDGSYGCNPVDRPDAPTAAIVRIFHDD